MEATAVKALEKHMPYMIIDSSDGKYGIFNKTSRYIYDGSRWPTTRNVLGRRKKKTLENKINVVRGSLQSWSKPFKSNRALPKIITCDLRGEQK